MSSDTDDAVQEIRKAARALKAAGEHNPAVAKAIKEELAPAKPAGEDVAGAAPMRLLAVTAEDQAREAEGKFVLEALRRDCPGAFEGSDD